VDLSESKWNKLKKTGKYIQEFSHRFHRPTAITFSIKKIFMVEYV
jgi:hypothetical protein